MPRDAVDGGLALQLIARMAGEAQRLSGLVEGLFRALHAGGGCARVPAWFVLLRCEVESCHTEVLLSKTEMGIHIVKVAWSSRPIRFDSARLAKQLQPEVSSWLRFYWYSFNMKTPSTSDKTAATATYANLFIHS